MLDMFVHQFDDYLGHHWMHLVQLDQERWKEDVRAPRYTRVFHGQGKEGWDSNVCSKDIKIKEIKIEIKEIKIEREILQKTFFFYKILYQILGSEHHNFQPKV